MSIEQFANNAESTLNGAINNSVTSLDVTSAASFPATGQFRIKIDAEILLVTAVSSNTFTVTRGAEGTMADSHANGVAVVHTVTKGALDKRNSDYVISDAIGSRPSAGRAGALFLPTNGLQIQKDDGANFIGYGPLYKFKQPPAVASWTADNLGSGVATDQGGIITLTAPAQNGEQLRALYKSAPSTPYVITAAMLFFGTLMAQANSVVSFGIAHRESSSGKYRSVEVTQSAANTTRTAHRITSWTSATATSSIGANTVFSAPTGIFWFRIEDDGANRKFSISHDGINWGLLLSESRTTFCTGNQIAFFINPHYSAGTPAFDPVVQLLSYEES